MGKLRSSTKKQGGKKAASSGSKFSKKSVVKTDIYDEGDDDLKGKQKLRANATDKYSKSAMKDMDFDEEGKVLYGDDESIDSDGDSIGWNSEDDAAYGGMLNKKKRAAGSEDENEAEDSDDDEGAGGTLLSDMLGGLGAGAAQRPKPASDLDDLFDGADEGSEQEEASEDESDGDADGYEGLLSAVDRFSKTPDGAVEKSRPSRQSQFAPESQFSSADPSKLSISTLLGALSADSRGLSAVKTRLADLEKSSSAPKAVDRVVSERVERGAAYEASKEDMNKWQATVVANRNAKTLDLAGDKRQLPSYKGLIEKFEASTDLERDIDMVLVESRGYEGDALQLEEAALRARHATPEQIKENMGELAKIRALMFYEQLKRHRINKIKSKAYHRIRNRKEKRNNKGKDGEDSDGLSDPEAENEAEEAAAARVKERMNLKHQNTTKWARMAQQYGKGNKELRMAYHESVQLGHDLAKKINRPDNGNSGDEHGYASSSGDEGEDAAARLKRQLRGIARGEGGFDDSNDAEANSKYKKLFDMDFMRNAKTRQQDKAREEAATLLREIEEMEQSDAGSGDEGGGQSKPKQPLSAKKLVDKERQALARQQMESMFLPGSAPAAAPAKAAAGGGASERTDDNPWLAGIGQIDRALDGKAAGGAKAAKKKAAAAGIKVSVPVKGEDVVVAAKADAAAPAGDRRKGHVVITMAGKKVRAVAVPPSTAATAAPADVVISNGSSKPKPEAGPKAAVAPTVNRNEPKKQILLQRSQEDLVKEAFAGPDYEAEFQSGKLKAIDDELDIDTKKQKIMTAVKPGWGDWAGVGLTGVSERTLKTRKRQLENLEEENDQKRKARRDGQVYNVMISDRRVKANSKYKVAEVPHPFTSREEYERSIQMPLGEEWNASHIVRRNTKPDIMLRAGRVVAPIKLAKEAGAAKKANISSNRRGLQ